MSVPDIGLGTSGNDDPDQCAASVEAAVEEGYRHIDTAQMYDNEAAVGRGVARADVPREELFVATKVHPENLAYDDVLATAEESLDRLGLEYVDLLYVHWPIAAYDAADTLPAFDELYDEGVARNVGVSNFTPDLVAEAADLLDAPIAANQVEIHPLLPPRDDLVETCDRHGVDLVAYAPFCRREALDVPEVTAVAEKHDVSPARTILAWLLEKDCKPIPKATGRDHIADNYAALDLVLDDEDVARIDSIERRYRKFDPEGSPWRE
ncbi:aldo/keto reductase [Halosegnis marinus]|uniref:Aldo/keto reductase n=1 Tax=Halosegnis marinus TaxID=3034023 RepID=A0ABD5ZQI7_9EURY|nr:aldo/keto reductase [Halosegnis sp. DT85]